MTALLGVMAEEEEEEEEVKVRLEEEKEEEDEAPPPAAAAIPASSVNPLRILTLNLELAMDRNRPSG